MNNVVKFRMTSSSTYQLSGLKVGGVVRKVKFTRSKKVASGTRRLYGLFQTEDVDLVKALINHPAFKSGYYTISAHENDAEYIKKVFGLEIEDLGVSQNTKIAEMKSAEKLVDLQVKYNLVVAERDELQLKLKEYEAQGVPTEVLDDAKGDNAVDEVVEVVEDNNEATEDGKEEPEEEEVVEDVKENVDSTIPRGEDISDDEFIEACKKLKDWNFETHRNHNQLKAIAKFFGVEFIDVADCVEKLTEVQGLL